MISVIQVLRTYALYQCDRRVLALLLSVAALLFSLDCVGTVSERSCAVVTISFEVVTCGSTPRC